MTRIRLIERSGFSITTPLVLAVLTPALLVSGCGFASSANAGECGYAFVFDSPIAPSAYQQQTNAGIQKAARQLKIKIKTVESTDAASTAANLRAFARDRCYKVVATGGSLAVDGLKQVADQFPQQRFAIFDAQVAKPNVTSYEFASEQGSYVVGTMAAMMTKTKTVAATFGLDVPVLKRYRYGFEQGVHAVDPKIKVVVQFAGSFDDPAKSLTAAVTARSQGADIVFPQSGSDYSVLKQSCEKGYRIIGAYPPEAQKASSDCVLSLFGTNITDSVPLFFNGVVKGTTKLGTTRMLTLSDKAFTIAPLTSEQQPYSKRIPADVLKRAQQASDDIVSGKVKLAFKG